MHYETVHFAIDEAVATIRLNRPATLNAFDDQMIAETSDAFARCGSDSAVRCVVLTGSGRAFSAGQDLKDAVARGEAFSIDEQVRQGYNSLIAIMVQLQKPIIAAVNGIAAGAGCGVALAADLRLASDQATFLLAFSRVGLVPDSGTTWLLPRVIGHARAFEMAATGDPVDARTALGWGLVNDVVPAAQLEEIVAAWARRLASGPTLALGLTKRAFWTGWEQSLPESLELEAELQAVAGRSPDAREGLIAFLEKRAPRFRGE
jgi:2-(1,2-epoxy-1,2-dihydrophenyl)acetyl-CoA isomerase